MDWPFVYFVSCEREEWVYREGKKIRETMLIISITNQCCLLPWEPSKVLITIYQFYNEICNVAKKNSAMFRIYKHVI